jgi:pimeloyl-ACP methyl ester carboxylesterase
VHALGRVYPGAYRHALDALPTFDRRAPVLQRLAAPVLLLGGEADRCTPPAALEALAQVLPDAVHVSLPQVGHWPQLESPEAFDAVLLHFLAERRVLH